MKKVWEYAVFVWLAMDYKVMENVCHVLLVLM
jgi:hypothetical protein